MKKKRIFLLGSAIATVVFTSLMVFAFAIGRSEPVPLSILDVVKWEVPNNNNDTMINAKEGAAATFDADAATCWKRGGNHIIIDLGDWYDISKVGIVQMTAGAGNVFAVYGSANIADIEALGIDDASRGSAFCLYSDKAGADKIPTNAKRNLDINSNTATSANALKNVRYLKVWRGNQLFDFKVYGDIVAAATDKRIPLTESMMVDSSHENAKAMLDGKLSGEYWNASSNDGSEVYMLVDLGAYYKLSDFKIFNHRNDVSYDFYAGNDVNALVKCGTVSAGAFGAYPGKVSLDIPVRYVKLVKTSTVWMQTLELCVYGKFDRAVIFSDVTLDPKNGEKKMTINVESGMAVGKKLPDDPVNGDKGFMGWYYKDKAGEEQQLTAATTVTEKIDAYAKWTSPINITTDNVISNYNIEAKDSIKNLLDGNTNTVYNVDKENQIIIDLKAYYDISLLRVFRYRENNTATVRMGETMADMAVVIHYEGGTTADRGWVNYTAVSGNKVRYIQIDKSWGAISELAVCGEKTQEIPTYTVSFVSNTDTAVPSQAVIENGFASLPSDLKKTNYRFEGWFTDSSFTREFSSKSPVNGNLTLWAKWVDIWAPVTYTVTFDCMGGESCDPISNVAEGGKITLPSPKRSGYVFGGWYKEPALTNAFPADGVVNSKMTLYAKWIEIKATDPQINVSASNLMTEYQTHLPNGQVVENRMPNMIDGNIATSWNNFNENDAIFDLGDYYRISFAGVSITGWENFSISVGKTTDSMREMTVMSVTSGKFNGWKFSDNAVMGRYVKVHRSSATALNELMLYGRPVPDSGYSLNAISDLKATNIDNDDPYVELSWTTPSVSGFEGTADNYEIRYSTSPISEGNFESATLLTSDDFMEGDAGIPSPNNAGSTQKINVYGLRGSTYYYFAVRTKVDWTQVAYSDISNVAALTTSVDVIPPAQITDFDTVLVGSKRVKFSLKAVGGNKNRGKCAYYDLRYSTAPITDENWDSAVSFKDVVTVKKAGTPITFLIGGLQPYTGYYFAVKAVDYSGNQSLLSNEVSFRTPVLDETSPSSVSNLSVKVKGTKAILTWTAPGNDGMDGMAYGYDFRFSDSVINDGNFSEAQAVLQDVEPVLGGTQQTAEISGLEPGKYYYIAMKTTDIDENTSAISNVVKIAMGKKISLSPEKSIIAEFPNGTVGAFVDEQEKCGDPANSSNGYNPSTKWQIKAYNLVPSKEQTITIDLGAEYDVTEVYLFDGQGSGDVKFYMGQPFVDWEKPVYTDPQTAYLQWKSFSPNMRSRYIRLQSDVVNWPTEIIVYGIKSGREDYVSTKKNIATNTTFDKSMGVNCFIDEPMDMISVAGNIRDYQNWRWNSGNPTLYPNNLYSFSPSLAGGGWDFDRHYKNLRDFDIRIMADIKESYKFIFGGDKAAEKPVLGNNDPTDPNSYVMHADAMYQYAARWGSTKVPDENLKLSKNQKKQSGMNLITTIEDWNEQDATWLMRRAYFTPFEYAAMCSADYDGHCGTMGKTVGAKNADPNIDFAMSGLAGCGTQYIHAMNFWFKYNRKDGKFAADTLNFHIYANSSGSTQYQTGETEGMCFEKTTVPSTLQSVMNYRDAYLPDKKVMISEFGWDTNIESPQGVREFGSLTAQIVQAQWMMRAYMINFSLGIDESQMYMLRDVGTGNGKYATCGLVTQKPQTEKEVQTRKTSWYYLYAMKNALKDMKFVKRVDMGDPDLWVFQFQNSAGNKAYAVWSGTQEDRKLPKVTIPLEGGNQYTMVEMKNDPETDKITTTGLYTPIKAENNAYVIPWVTETPIFLLEGDHKVPVAPVWQDGDDVTSERVSDDKVKINWSTAKSDIDIMYYTIYLNDKKYTSISGKENSMLLPFDDKTAYSVKIFAGDTCGQETVEPLYASKPVDFYKPSKPRNISLLMASSNKISLQWEEPTDNYDVPGSISYRMYDKEKNLVAEGKSTHLVADKLSASTEYTFTVTAVDAAGNESEPSKSITVSTTKGDLPLWALIVIISLSVLILALAIISAIIYMRKNGGFKNSMKKLSQKFAHGKNGHKEAVEIPDSVSISESIYSNSEDEAKKEGDADGDTSIAQ